MIRAADFTKAAPGRVPFNTNVEATVAALRRLADDIEAQRVHVLRVTVAERAAENEFTTQVLRLRLAEKAPT